MASDTAIRMALKSLVAAGYAGDITAERVKAWHWALEDLTDAQVQVGTERTIREYTNPFLPPAAVIREKAGANRVAPDVDQVVRRISALGGYAGGNVGWCAPRGDVVREKLGDAVADAYASVGGERLFGGDDTGRSIALRDFGQALSDAVAAHGPNALAAPSRPAIAAPVKQLVSSTATALRRPMAARELGPEAE